MKRFLPLFIALCLLLALAPKAAAMPNGVISAAVYDPERQSYSAPQDLPVVKLRLNEQPVSGEMPGVILDERTMAPLRFLAERLNAQVEWLPEGDRVRITRDDNVILLTLGSATAQLNDAEQSLPGGVPATLMRYHGKDHTMVPVRFFSEALGCQVDWQQERYTAWITERGYIEERTAELLGDLETPEDPSVYLIALDAGHGGIATGAYYEETAEKDLNLSIARRVEALLDALGFRTMMTRRGDWDVELAQRAQMANEAGADLFVSIHCNAAEKAPDFSGVYVYHFPDSTAGEALAQRVQTAVCAATGALDRGIASANFAVLRHSAMPAILVESGFMTCHEELERLRSEAYQTRIAQGIAAGVARHLTGQS